MLTETTTPTATKITVTAMTWMTGPNETSPSVYNHTEMNTEETKSSHLTGKPNKSMTSSIENLITTTTTKSKKEDC